MAKKDEMEPVTRVLAETENYLAWEAEEPDGEGAVCLRRNHRVDHRGSFGEAVALDIRFDCFVGQEEMEGPCVCRRGEPRGD